MAVLNITFDTVEKTMTVTRDGAEIPNVVGASVGQSYLDDDVYRCEIVMHEEDEENKLDMWYRLTAGENQAPTDKVAGFSVAERREGGDISAEVAEYFAGRKR